MVEPRGHRFGSVPQQGTLGTGSLKLQSFQAKPAVSSSGVGAFSVL